MSEAYKTYRKVIGKDLVVSLQHYYDEDGMLDEWYGNFTDSPKEDFYLDRRKGLLRGPRKTWTEDFTSEEAKDERVSELEDLDFGVDDVFTAVTIKYDTTDRDGNPLVAEQSFTDDQQYACEDYIRDMARDHGYYITYEEERTTWRIEITGDEILDSDCHTDYEHRTYRYIEMSDCCGNVPSKPWETLSDEEKREYIGYMKQVDQRVHDYVNNWWGYIGIAVSVHWKGEKIGRASTWGIESDLNDDDLGQCERELISEALDEAIKHFGYESKRYGVTLLPPDKLIELAALSIDELKPIHEQLKQYESHKHFHSFIGDLDDEEQALYDGVELAGEDEEHV